MQHDWNKSWNDTRETRRGQNYKMKTPWIGNRLKGLYKGHERGEKARGHVFYNGRNLHWINRHPHITSFFIKKPQKLLPHKGKSSNEKLKLSPSFCVLKQLSKCKFSTPLKSMNNWTMVFYDVMLMFLHALLMFHWHSSMFHYHSLKIH